MNEHTERINAHIASGFEKIEKKLKEATNVAHLFEILFMEIQEEFHVPFVWLTLIDTTENNNLIRDVKASEFLKDRVNIIPEDFFYKIFLPDAKPLLLNRNLRPYYKLLPDHKKYFIKSMALVPFKIHEIPRGSWNNGDSLSSRYTPEMETTLLQKFSRSLSQKLNELT